MSRIMAGHQIPSFLRPWADADRPAGSIAGQVPTDISGETTQAGGRTISVDVDESDVRPRTVAVDPRFIQDGGSAVFIGQELLAKGALEVEGGVHLLTGVPGAPIGPVFDTLKALAPLLDTHGQVARVASNEAIAAGMLNGAQLAGCRAMAFFKSTGLHRAGDVLAMGVQAGTAGRSGSVVVIGDDTWHESTTVPMDVRGFAESIQLPIIEPSTPQELKDWVALAFRLGAAARIPVGMLLTTLLADGGGSVRCAPNQFPLIHERQKRTLRYRQDIEPALDQTIPLPPRAAACQGDLSRRLNTLKAAARRLEINRMVNMPQRGEVAPLGFIASGAAYAMLQHALGDMRVSGRLPVLKLGMVHPLDPGIVEEFARQCRQIVVVEERRPFIERQVAALFASARQAGGTPPTVFGRQFPRDLPGIPADQPLTPSILIERLAPLIKTHPTLPIELANPQMSGVRQMLEIIAEAGSAAVNLPQRTPTFCAGCPHRDSASVLLELRDALRDPQYMLQKHKRKAVELICHGDAGCSTLLGFEPNRSLLHTLSGTGVGGAAAGGAGAFIENRQLVFMGDGTFFHSGQATIADAIHAGRDVTYVILDNHAAALVGQHGHAGDDVDLMGRDAMALNIQRIIEGMIPRKPAREVHVARINPADRGRFRTMLEQTVLAPGVNVIIADKQCAITHQREVRAAARLAEDRDGFIARERHANVATEVCDLCMECTTRTACPGLTLTPTDHGTKVQTDTDVCVDDGACRRISACPSFEQVIVTRKAAPRVRWDEFAARTMPAAPRPLHAGQDAWRCFIAGVGGSGVGVVASILAAAGHEMGYDVQFARHKGIAVRTGGVYAQVLFTQRKSDRTATPMTTSGMADLLLGIDLLEAARAIDPRLPFRVASAHRTAAVVNAGMTPTVAQMMGHDEYHPRAIEAALRKRLHADHTCMIDLAGACEHWLGSRRYINVAMLGVAFQRGCIPLPLEMIEQAIWSVLAGDARRNLDAFSLGRRLVAEPDMLRHSGRTTVETPTRVLRRKVQSLRRMRGRRHAAGYIALLREFRRRADRLPSGDPMMTDLIVAMHDCMVWGGPDYARRYAERVLSVFRRDDPARDYALTRVVVRNLARMMLIKDEMYVAAMLTCPEKQQRDRERFNVAPERGDRIRYRHHCRFDIELLGRRIGFEMTMRDWSLKLLAKMRFLRTIVPGWRRRETQFRDWYETLVDRCDGQMLADRREYQRWLAVLDSVRGVTGFADVRQARMAAARQQADRWLAEDPGYFEPPARLSDGVQSPATVAASHAGRTVALHVLGNAANGIRP